MKASIARACWETHVAKCKSSSTWRNAIKVNRLSMLAYNLVRRIIFIIHTLEGILLVNFATYSSRCIVKQSWAFLSCFVSWTHGAFICIFIQYGDVVLSRDTPETAPVSPALLRQFPRLLHKVWFHVKVKPKSRRQCGDWKAKREPLFNWHQKNSNCR